MLINGPGSIGKPHGKKILSPTLHLIQKSILDDLFLEENIGEYLVASEQAKSLFFFQWDTKSTNYMGKNTEIKLYEILNCLFIKRHPSKSENASHRIEDSTSI